jgi:hypothetical protein
MSDAGPTVVYALCLAASVLCAFLLLRRYLVHRTPLLLGVALGFGALAMNNLLLVADMVLFPNVDLWLWRQLTAGAAIGVMLYGFIWERDL